LTGIAVWHDLENPQESYEIMHGSQSKMFEISTHIENLHHNCDQFDEFPKPSQIYNAVIVATYNESYEILAPTIHAVLDGTYDNKHIILT
jgi:cellulose synthase/poly-beta-1,6-N-acetylglucosamine synthase-like glycosyltransferase